jgi:uncharacterized protein (TIGR00290 family)
VAKPQAAVSWSGGKDCFLALHRVRELYDVIGLFTIMTEDGGRSRSHGLRPEILARQASILGIPHLSQNASWADYDQAFSMGLAGIKRQGASHMIFGDIFPEANRIWAEEISSKHGLEAVEPLYGEPTYNLAHEFISTGALAVITTVRSSCFDRSFLGRRITAELVEELLSKGIDPCGEKGEFHTLVARFSHTGTAIPIRAGFSHEEKECIALDFQLSE